MSAPGTRRFEVQDDAELRAYALDRLGEARAALDELDRRRAARGHTTLREQVAPGRPRLTVIRGGAS